MEHSGEQLRAEKPEELKTPLLLDPDRDGDSVFSPDGKWLAYESKESGKLEVYVLAVSPAMLGQGKRWQISNSGGDNPMWNGKNHELLYQSGDQMMAVRYTVKGDSFMPEKPRVWLSKLGGAMVFGIAPDGKRLAALVPEVAPEAVKPDHEVTVVFNFAEELRRRVLVGK